MRSGKGNQEYDEYEEDDFNSKKDGPSSNTSNNLAAANTKDKNSEKANAIRSKHSVTEQRRRSKINERFQILRDLIPHSEQKRDTASFLLEVIDYVKYLQEKVQKYEGSYPAWSSEPTKLMPWRNSHWRVPSFVGQPHPAKNGSGAVPTISGKFEENNIGIASSVMVTQQNSLDLESGQDLANKSMDQQAELSKQEVHNPIPAAVRSDGVIADPLQRPGQDSQSAECPITGNILARQEDSTVEGGTISISSVYSQGLLNTLTEALQSAGIDLSQARISVQIDLGKRANRGSTSGTFTDHEGSLPGNSVMAHVHGEDSTDHLQKRQKT